MAIRDQDLPQDMPAAGSMPERLGDFRLLERLGAGGMGVVYLARQESLQRDVALKLILPEHLYFEEARERFRREVEAVAKLNHSGIVPVYSVGEEHGLPFFTMELVEGCSLATVIEELKARRPESLSGADLREAIAKHTRRFHDASASGAGASAFSGTWVQACCRLVLQVAEALQHAHDRGVVHRDVKPSNIVVTPQGRAMLLDFGLASDESASRITRSGSHVGSLPYMSPERVRGGSVAADVRADVYSLGVSFYELLSLRLPFEHTSIQELFQAILAGDCEPLRQRNPGVPWDAATVCATAMERDLARRYADTESLASDLRNLLELRPIAAEPPSSGLRTKRWIQRHPTQSVATALGFLLLVVAPGVAWWRIARERDLAVAELTAREGMQGFLRQLIDAADPEANGSTGGRSLEELVDVGTERIRGELEEFPEVRSQLMLSLSGIQRKLGRPAEAIKLSLEAVELIRGLHGADSLSTAEGERVLAANLISVGEIERALSLLSHARKMTEEQAAAPETELWGLDFDIAAALVIQKNFEQARVILERLESAANSPLKTSLGDRVTWLAAMSVAEKGLGRFEAAEARMKEAVDVATQQWGRKHVAVARALQNLAALHIDLGQLELALPELEEARDIRAFASESIEDSRLAHNLGAVHNKLGHLELALEQLKHSLALSRRFAGDSEQTAREASGVGALLYKLGRIDEAETFLREALLLSRRFIARRGLPAIEAPLWLARCRTVKADPDEAATLWQEVLDCGRDDPTVPDALRAKWEGEYADVLTTLGRTEEAAQYRQHAQ